MKLSTSLLPLATLLAACEGASPTATAHAAQAARDLAQATAAAPSSTEPAATAPMTPTAPTPPPAAPYTVRGILDPGMQNIVAFALKIPRGWHLQQAFTRKWNGATPITQVSLRLLAPDGQQQIDFLPERPYYYQDGPTARSLRQQAASMGLATPRHDEYELPPMAPLAYIRQVLLPNLAQQGFRLQPTGQHEQPAGGSSATGYVDGRLPNGRRARVECVVNTHATNMSGEVYYQWAALPSITQTSGELAPTFAYTQAARKSFSINPAWQRLNQQLTQRGQHSNQEATQRDAEAYRAYQQHQLALQQQTTADRQRLQDQIAQARGDLLSGKTRYDNPATGDRYRVDDRYNHVYQDRNGALHGSNVPLDAGALDWQELQQVELKNY
ncbi:hypothetical protein HHL22_17805 [Hymenobacter sp. RP-2-7]|uniref:Uncharacterized protein n=1 Tax=Hymenobacter polaris TaxID=2682546 RepID=A0A7Y0FP10_9BACT|nr:hypothetical protein [Hymenobacter polaris]NML67065.1 hypothetical protein [Hymenobacter polaris]